MLKITNLNYTLGESQLLKNICLDFQKGQTYGIIGPNGAGKSTLLKHIMRIIEPPKNSIFYEGEDITRFRIKNYAEKVSFVFQENTRQLDMSVYDILLMGRYTSMDIWGNVSNKDHELIETILNDLGISHLKDRTISSLSGGEAQKVFIGRALVQNTPLLLLDEPTSMLDIHNAIELIELIMKLKAKHHLTIIFVLHDLNLAFNYCDHIILMNHGEIVLADTRTKVLRSEHLQAVYHHRLQILEAHDTFYVVPAFS